MTVATRSKRQTKAKPGTTPAATNGKADAAHRLPAPAHLEVAIAKLTNELNPRHTFDAEKLEALAATIKTTGLLQPLVVRPHPKKLAQGFYQVVAGGRRLRACQRAGLAAVPCESYPLSDSEALEIALVENLQREDLNALEEAAAFEQATRPAAKGGLGITQTALAERLGCTQGHISNRIRLLTLPAKWRARVISGEMTAGHARELVPYTHPELMKILDQTDSWEKEPWKLTVKGFRDWIERRIENGTRSLAEGHSCWANNWKPIQLQPTDEQRARLCLVTITDEHGRKEERVTNVKLYDELVRAELDKLKQKKAKREEASEAKDKQLSPADKRKADAKKAEQYRRRLEELRVDWLRYLVWQVFADAKQVPARGRFTPTRVLLWLIAEDGGYAASGLRDKVCDAAIGFAKKDLCRSGEQWWQGIAAVDDKRMPEVALDLVRRMFYDETDGPCAALPACVVEGAAAELAIDVEAAWRREKCGPLTERYFSLHSKDQLLALSDEVDGSCDSGMSKAEMVGCLVGSVSAQKHLPRELTGKKGK